MKTARGFTLIEMNLLVIIIGVFALGLMSLSTLTTKGLAEVKVKNKANSLAVAMIEEIKCRKWDELTAPLKSTVMGVNTGEVASNKLTFDDIDDFSGYSEAQPLYRDGTPMTGYDGFSINVDTVCYVDALLNYSATPTPRKKIAITVNKNGIAKVTLNTIVSQKNGL